MHPSFAENVEVVNVRSCRGIIWDAWGHFFIPSAFAAARVVTLLLNMR